MGPGDKSLANLPVTQLLAPVTREPQRPQRGKQQNGGRFISCAKKAISPLGQGNTSSHLAPQSRSVIQIKLQNVSETGFSVSRNQTKIYR